MIHAEFYRFWLAVLSCLLLPLLAADAHAQSHEPVGSSVAVEASLSEEALYDEAVRTLLKRLSHQETRVAFEPTPQHAWVRDHPEFSTFLRGVPQTQRTAEVAWNLLFFGADPILLRRWEEAHADSSAANVRLQSTDGLAILQVVNPREIRAMWAYALESRDLAVSRGMIDGLIHELPHANEDTLRGRWRQALLWGLLSEDPIVRLTCLMALMKEPPHTLFPMLEFFELGELSGQTEDLAREASERLVHDARLTLYLDTDGFIKVHIPYLAFRRAHFHVTRSYTLRALAQRHRIALAPSDLRLLTESEFDTLYRDVRFRRSWLAEPIFEYYRLAESNSRDPDRPSDAIDRPFLVPMDLLIGGLEPWGELYGIPGQTASSGVFQSWFDSMARLAEISNLRDHTRACDALGFLLSDPEQFPAQATVEARFAAVCPGDILEPAQSRRLQDPAEQDPNASIYAYYANLPESGDE